MVLIFNGVALTGCAVFDSPLRTSLLAGLMLLLPMLDKSWSPPNLSIGTSRRLLWGALVAASALIILIEPTILFTAITMLFFAAIPEEWFFRAYFMKQIERLCYFTGTSRKLVYENSGYISNILSSIFFSLLHIPSQGLLGLVVFFPSIFYGWIYQKTEDIILVILLHTLSNIFYMAFKSMLIQS